VDKAVAYIRGQRGTNVILKIRRSGSEMTITVQREVITIPEISVTWQGDIAILQLTQFGETTEKKIRSTFSEIAAKRPKGIVIDLRNNGGGLLLAADTLMSALVPRGSTVAQVVSPTETSLEKTQDDAVVDPSTKIAVLVNKGSASASEIVAGALQDLKRATIVGKQTFGKGTVQEVIGFRTGEALKLTIAEWLTPNGRHIDKVGVTPDVVVDSDNRDDQLRRALRATSLEERLECDGNVRTENPRVGGSIPSLGTDSRGGGRCFPPSSVHEWSSVSRRALHRCCTRGGARGGARGAGWLRVGCGGAAELRRVDTRPGRRGELHGRRAAVVRGLWRRDAAYEPSRRAALHQRPRRGCLGRVRVPR
jgi:hypothetical protein